MNAMSGKKQETEENRYIKRTHIKTRNYKRKKALSRKLSTKFSPKTHPPGSVVSRFDHGGESKQKQSVLW